MLARFRKHVDLSKMLRTALQVGVGLCAICALPHSAAGQTAGSNVTVLNAAQGVERAQLLTLQREASVRIRLTSGPRFRGRYDGLVGDTILLQTNATEERLPVASVDSLWERHPPIARNAVWGALNGGLLAAVLTFVGTFHLSCSNPYGLFGLRGTCRGTTGDVAGATILGAWAGASVGVVIARAFPEWRLRFP